ncbi:hypothetical protein KUCAC02_004439, partial [Chaenocephalus aceratus]
VEPSPAGTLAFYFPQILNGIKPRMESRRKASIREAESNVKRGREKNCGRSENGIGVRVMAYQSMISHRKRLLLETVKQKRSQGRQHPTTVLKTEPQRATTKGRKAEGECESLRGGVRDDANRGKAQGLECEAPALRL